MTAYGTQLALPFSNHPYGVGSVFIIDPLYTLLWRVVAVDGEHFHEGFYSLLDAEPRLLFDRFERGAALAKALQGLDAVQRIAAFSKGFYKLQQAGDRVPISDLRMGQEPSYIFSFEVARRQSLAVAVAVVPPIQIGARLDLARGLPWLWRRALGEPLPPPSRRQAAERHRGGRSEATWRPWARSRAVLARHFGA